MPTLSTRFRTWVASVEFAVTATSIVVALLASLLVAAQAASDADTLFVVMLAGITAPNLYDQQWSPGLDSRLAGVAWGLAASLALVACFLALSAGLRAVAEPTVASVVAFVAAWLAGVAGARVTSNAFAA